jgi:hypothetical protein
VIRLSSIRYERVFQHHGGSEATGNEMLSDEGATSNDGAGCYIDLTVLSCAAQEHAISLNRRSHTFFQVPERDRKDFACLRI